MDLIFEPGVTSLAADPQASRAAARLPGKQICADLKEHAGSFQVHWCMIVRGNAPYLRQEVTIQAGAQPIGIGEVQLLHFPAEDAYVAGTVAGSPIVAGNFYMGFEHPLSSRHGHPWRGDLQPQANASAERGSIHNLLIGHRRSEARPVAARLSCLS